MEFCDIWIVLAKRQHKKGSPLCEIFHGFWDVIVFWLFWHKLKMKMDLLCESFHGFWDLAVLAQMQHENGSLQCELFHGFWDVKVFLLFRHKLKMKMDLLSKSFHGFWDLAVFELFGHKCSMKMVLPCVNPFIPFGMLQYLDCFGKNVARKWISMWILSLLLGCYNNSPNLFI